MGGKPDFPYVGCGLIILLATLVVLTLLAGLDIHRMRFRH